MLTLIERIRERLQQNAYTNEAAVSHGVVTPILNALGWDSADPEQLVPEFSILRGRVDFALFGLGHRPAVFIEVKQVGRAVDGDRQLFEYAFHQGVQLCVLTDGREWSFYLPSGQGSYEDRRVYRLLLDDREPTECERILNRYLARDRVRDQRAFEDAQRDHRDAAGKREATAVLPRAWAELAAEANELLIETLGEKAEALCGYRPEPANVLAFLRRLNVAGRPSPQTDDTVMATPQSAPEVLPLALASDKTMRLSLLGKTYDCPTAASALIEVLRALAARDDAKMEELAARIRTSRRSLIAHAPADINPGRPDLARAAEFAPGWLVGLNISNREKMAIIRAACSVYGLEMPADLDVSLPNAS